MNFRSEQVEEEQALDDLDFEFIVKNKSQRQKKKAKRNNRIPWIDPKPFDNLDVDVPVSKQSAQDLADDILGDQKRILEVSIASFGPLLPLM